MTTDKHYSSLRSPEYRKWIAAHLRATKAQRYDEPGATNFEKIVTLVGPIGKIARRKLWNEIELAGFDWLMNGSEDFFACELITNANQQP